MRLLAVMLVLLTLNVFFILVGLSFELIRRMALILESLHTSAR